MWIEVALFAFLIAMAVVIARLRDLFAAAMLTGIFSLLSAGLFTVMDAVDVAFTEAAVGAGVATVLILATLSLSANVEDQRRWRPMPLVIVLLTGAALLWGTADLPAYGDPSAVIHHHVVPRYIEASFSEVGMPNIVTSVLASYRGYDTFGETTVIFTAGLCVMLLLGRGRPPTDAGPPAPPDASPSASADLRLTIRMRDITVLKTIARLLLPVILLFALYVQFHGDFGPGGGFQAGVIFAAAVILHGLVFGLDTLRRALPPAAVGVGLAAGLLLYGEVGLVAMALGGHFLDYGALVAGHPMAGQHLGILLVELGVGVTVWATMTLIFYELAGRWQR